MEEEISRKDFFRKGIFSIVKPFAEAVEKKIDGVKTGLLRPPGAVDEVSFIALCTKCDLCKEACPHGAIRLAPMSYGVAVRTPYIDPATEPCRLCEDLPCIEVCEPGALVPVERADVAMGEAVIDEKSCLAWRGVMCESCAAACPFPGEAIRLDAMSRPEVVPERCTGCGLCVKACVTTPPAVKVIAFDD
ncbi:MAG TPA: 4Fe-4S dicluster domain-containing protein [Deltaproteobacteria bacterium]|nr:4Fe-4S dicluster domain-containing protein [Deltaproteobacteria bacterium]